MKLGEGLIFTASLMQHENNELSARHRRGELVKLSTGVYYPRKPFQVLRPGEKSLLASVAIGAAKHDLVGRSAGAIWLYLEIDARRFFTPEVRGRAYRSQLTIAFRAVPQSGMYTVSFLDREI